MIQPTNAIVNDHKNKRGSRLTSTSTKCRQLLKLKCKATNYILSTLTLLLINLLGCSSGEVERVV